MTAILEPLYYGGLWFATVLKAILESAIALPNPQGLWPFPQIANLALKGVSLALGAILKFAP